MASRRTAPRPIESAAKEVFQTSSVRATVELGRKLAQRLKRGDCVALEGPLGAGKTVLVRGLALGLGLAEARSVSSPTFVLAQEYATSIPVFHLDLYRMTEPGAELEALGLEEMLSLGIVVIEWAQRAPQALPRPHWHVTIEPTGPRSRRFEVSLVE